MKSLVEAVLEQRRDASMGSSPAEWKRQNQIEHDSRSSMARKASVARRIELAKVMQDKRIEDMWRAVRKLEDERKEFNTEIDLRISRLKAKMSGK